MRLLEPILSIIAPHECVGCGAEGSLLCHGCSARLGRPVERCYRCHRAAPASRCCPSCRRSGGLYAVRSAVRYEGAAKDLVWRLKFGRASAAASNMADMMLPLLLAAGEPLPDLLVHVPTATSRVRLRGYDQAALLSRQLSRASGIPCRRLLLRRGQHQQVGTTRLRRAAQLRGDFRPRGSDKVRGRFVLLIDDVVTTGATLEAAAAALKQVGAARVEALVFAQA